MPRWPDRLVIPVYLGVAVLAIVGLLVHAAMENADKRRALQARQHVFMTQCVEDRGETKRYECEFMWGAMQYKPGLDEGPEVNVGIDLTTGDPMVTVQ